MIPDSQLPKTLLERFTAFMEEAGRLDPQKYEDEDDRISSQEAQAFELIEDWLSDGFEVEARGNNRYGRFIEFMDHD